MSEAARIQATQAYPSAGKQLSKTGSGSGPSFAETMSQVEELRFSNHAQNRLKAREITLNGGGIERLKEAVERADARGCRESLVLMDDLAFIVNVKDRVVVTAMDATNRGEGVFTQIDSVVLADDDETITTDLHV